MARRLAPPPTVSHTCRDDQAHNHQNVLPDKSGSNLFFCLGGPHLTSCHSASKPAQMQSTSGRSRAKIARFRAAALGRAMCRFRRNSARFGTNLAAWVKVGLNSEFCSVQFPLQWPVGGEVQGGGKGGGWGPGWLWSEWVSASPVARLLARCKSSLFATSRRGPSAPRHGGTAFAGFHAVLGRMLPRLILDDGIHIISLRTVSRVAVRGPTDPPEPRLRPYALTLLSRRQCAGASSQRPP